MNTEDDEFDRIARESAHRNSGVLMGASYTIPQGQPLPKRQWVGLTDDERDKIILGRQARWEIAHMIEAKLKEKNA